MADTLQAVIWSLERKCVFRSGDDWFLPRTAFSQLADLRTIAESQTRGRILDGICVTGITTGRDCSGRCHNVPVSGFRIVDRIGPGCELSAVRSICGECEANAESKLANKVAGCYGHLSVCPYSRELDEQLWAIIKQRHLEDRLHSGFPATTPLWFGFWIESPLKRPQATFLHELLGAACGQNARLDRDLAHFVNALKIAIDRELPLHVSIGPPGHSDFGYVTTFPHCPRCKAEAPVERWKPEYPNDPLECRICGHTFNPNEHHSCREDNYSDGGDLLEHQLGKAGYEEFTKRYLLSRGKTEQQAAEVIDSMNHGPLLRRIAAVRKQREATIRELRIGRVGGKTNDLAQSITLPLTDDVALELVLAPAGEFLMGTSEGSIESPRHVVRFERPFYIGRSPVTQGQWAAVMGENTSLPAGTADLPVDQMSWFDCQEFCEVLSHRQRRVVRLPSEAEWEYACRAGTMTTFAFGDALSPEQANFLPSDQDPFRLLAEGERLDERLKMTENAPQERRPMPTPAGSHPPNAWGIYDMHGNVNEWCEDVWHADYIGAPADGSAWLEGEDAQPFRVARGGCCSYAESACTSAARQQLRADAGSSEKRGGGKRNVEPPDPVSRLLFALAYRPYGFRVVCEAD